MIGLESRHALFPLKLATRVGGGLGKGVALVWSGWDVLSKCPQLVDLSVGGAWERMGMHDRS
jgi:hypothetical protein